MLGSVIFLFFPVRIPDSLCFLKINIDVRQKMAKIGIQLMRLRAHYLLSPMDAILMKPTFLSAITFQERDTKDWIPIGHKLVISFENTLYMPGHLLKKYNKYVPLIVSRLFVSAVIVSTVSPSSNIICYNSVIRKPYSISPIWFLLRLSRHFLCNIYFLVLLF